MTALLIVLSILALIFLLLVLPVTVDLNYKNELCYRIKYAAIVLFDSEKRIDIKKVKRKKKTKVQSHSEEKSAKKESFFKKTYAEKGFFGTVKYFSELIGLILKKLWWIVKRLKFSRFVLDLTVATDDAANTALEYGGICCAVYPVLAFIETNAKFKSKSVNISADFDKKEPEFAISLSVTTRLIYFLIAAISALKEYLKLQHKESENNERK